MKLAQSVMAILLFAALSCSARAEQVSLLHAASFAGQRGALFDMAAPARDAEQPVRLASLFAGQGGASLFAPLPPRGGVLRHEGVLSSGVEGILQLIGQAEAGSLGYDAVQHGAVQRPAKRPSEMTVAEILTWIEQTPGQPHAIGRYQFIPATLRRLLVRLEIGGDAVFAPALQDRMALVLLTEAGLSAFRTGDLDRHAFMHNMAKVWAGFPTSSGASHYDGYAGNKATMTWAHFDAEMGRMFPG